MTETYHHQKNRLIALILSTLLGFNSLVAWYIYSSQKDRLLHDATERLVLESELVGRFLTDSLLRHEYAEAINLLKKWVASKPNITHLQVSLPGDLILYQHTGDRVGQDLIHHSGEIEITGRQIAIEIAQDLRNQTETIGRLGLLLILSTIGLTLLFGAVLWTILSRWILIPFQEELTRQTRQIGQLSHAYKALGESNLALLTAQNEEQLLQKVCQIVHQGCGYALVWIGYVAPKEQTIQVLAHHGESKGFLEHLDLNFQANRPHSPPAQSILQKRAIVSDHSKRGDTSLPWQTMALKKGLESSAAFPMVINNEAIGTMGVYAATGDAFSPQEVQLLSKLAANLGFGIVALRDRERVKKLSITDPLTGLFNRNRTNETVEAEVNRANRYQNRFAVILLDLDHFKRVNDTYGHQVGDGVLVAFAQIIQASCRNTDIVGRWGGEEFIVILPDNDAASAQRLAERICQDVQRHTFGEAGHITASLGVAEFIPQESGDSLIARADAALYRAKEQGRNRVILAD